MKKLGMKLLSGFIATVMLACTLGVGAYAKEADEIALSSETVTESVASSNAKISGFNKLAQHIKSKGTVEEMDVVFYNYNVWEYGKDKLRINLKYLPDGNAVVVFVDEIKTKNNTNYQQTIFFTLKEDGLITFEDYIGGKCKIKYERVINSDYVNKNVAVSTDFNPQTFNGSASQFTVNVKRGSIYVADTKAYIVNGLDTFLKYCKDTLGVSKADLGFGVNNTAKWKQSANGKWWYQNADGSYPKSAWKQIGGKWYYFDGYGYMVTGWKKISNKWYYFNGSGVMTKNTWVKGKASWSYTGSDGVMVTGWKKIGADWYYFNGSGVMAANKWVGSYWLKSNGAMAISSWVDGGKYYVGADGKWVPGKTK